MDREQCSLESSDPQSVAPRLARQRHLRTAICIVSKTFGCCLCALKFENHRATWYGVLEGNQPRNRPGHESYYQLRFLGGCEHPKLTSV